LDKNVENPWGFYFFFQILLKPDLLQKLVDMLSKHNIMTHILPRLKQWLEIIPYKQALGINW